MFDHALYGATYAIAWGTDREERLDAISHRMQQHQAQILNDRHYMVAGVFSALGAGVGDTIGGGGEPEEEAAIAGRLPDSALVCRGGLCTADRFANGTGVTLDAAGNLQGVSVQSAAGKTVQELTVGVKNPKVGVTTVGDIRRAGGDVVPSGTPGNPDHCTMCGITPEKAEELFTPVQPNPNR